MNKGSDAPQLAERIKREDGYLVDYLLGWAGEGPEQPWGAAMSFALEVAAGYGLIKGESNSTLTELGREVVRALTKVEDTE